MTDVARALTHVLNNIDTDTQWYRALTGLEKMNPLERARVWVELSESARHAESDLRGFVLHSQLKVLYKRALKVVEDAENQSATPFYGAPEQIETVHDSLQPLVKEMRNMILSLRVLNKFSKKMDSIAVRDEDIIFEPTKGGQASSDTDTKTATKIDQMANNISKIHRLFITDTQERMYDEAVKNGIAKQSIYEYYGSTCASMIGMRKEISDIKNVLGEIKNMINDQLEKQKQLHNEKIDHLNAELNSFSKKYDGLSENITLELRNGLEQIITQKAALQEENHHLISELGTTLNRTTELLQSKETDLEQRTSKIESIYESVQTTLAELPITDYRAFKSQVETKLDALTIKYGFIAELKEKLDSTIEEFNTRLQTLSENIPNKSIGEANQPQSGAKSSEHSQDGKGKYANIKAKVYTGPHKPIDTPGTRGHYEPPPFDESISLSPTWPASARSRSGSP